MVGGGKDREEMREILFKAKRFDNGEWVQGNLFIEENRAEITRSTCNGVGIEGVAVDKDTICQYTGLTDKNGNKIWENDVVKCVDKNSESEFVAVVEFGNPNGFYSWGYQLRHIEGDKPNLDILLWIDMEECGAYCEVIGNTFDNADLLKGE